MQKLGCVWHGHSAFCPRGSDHLPDGFPARRVLCSSRRRQNKTPADRFDLRALNSGDVLLSHGLSPYYHRGCSVSLPCSEWERVGPLRYGHQSPMPDWRYGCFAATRTDTVALVTVSDTDTLQFHFRKNMIFNPQSPTENPQFFWFSDIYIQVCSTPPVAGLHVAQRRGYRKRTASRLRFVLRSFVSSVDWNRGQRPPATA